MTSAPIYDPLKGYSENYEEGPFGDFADGKVYENKGDPTHDFLGQKVYLPFGIPAGPLLNSKFVKGAFDKGFDIAVYKTVRSGAYPCHPSPNILAVRVSGDLAMDKARNEPLVADTNFQEPLSITNSFGVPSKSPAEWQEDAKRAISFEKKGQVMILSFMGTVREGQTRDDFIADHVKAALSALETGVKAYEVNLSCPNIGNEGLICYDLEMTRDISRALRKILGNKPLILKVGFYQTDEDVKRLAAIASEYASAISAINTIPATIVNEKGGQALPGKNRVKSGVCGSCIRWAGLSMTDRLARVRQENNYSFKIIGVGGVSSPEDYNLYRDAGADAVMSATGATWNPQLAAQIKSAYLRH